MTEGADIVIVTPGRMLSHLTLGYVDLSSLEVLIRTKPTACSTWGSMRTSCESPPPPERTPNPLVLGHHARPHAELGPRIAERSCHGAAALSKPAANVKQGAYALFDHQKDAVLVDVLKERNVKSGIVFTSRKRTRGRSRALRKAGIKCGRMSSDLDQSEREEVMLAFRQQKLPSWWPPTWCPAASTSTASSLWSITTCLPTRRITFTGLAELPVPSARVRRSPSLTPDDMRRFGKIEKLIEKEVPQLEVPKSLGDAPVYDPVGRHLRRPRRSRRGVEGPEGRHFRRSSPRRRQIRRVFFRRWTGGKRHFKRRGKPGGGQSKGRHAPRRMARALSEEEHRVLRERHRAPRLSELNAEWREGRYACKGCGKTPFGSDSKLTQDVVGPVLTEKRNRPTS